MQLRLNLVNIGILSLVAAAKVSLDDGVWDLQEDFSKPNGSISLTSPEGKQYTLTRYLESYAQPENPYFGNNLTTVCETPEDILANKLLENGDPDPLEVQNVAIPVGSEFLGYYGYPGRVGWTVFVGTVNSTEVMPIYDGATRTNYDASMFISELGGKTRNHTEGFLGGAVPLTVFHYPLENTTDPNPTSYAEVLVFADADSESARLFPTYTRLLVVKDGKVSNTTYSGHYRPYGPFREAPTEEQFNAALIRTYIKWSEYLSQGLKLSVPEQDASDFALHAFAKEAIVRGNGITPRYGAVDRDYDGTEYDGFQDIFTSSLRANLDWGRFDFAKALIVDQFENVVGNDGMPSMRGPQTGQFGLELSLLARYGNLTGDWKTLAKYEEKIKAKAYVLTSLQDASLNIRSKDPGYGLIHGWSESDACLTADPSVWWKPYYGNTGLASRGLKDIAAVWGKISQQDSGRSQNWSKRAAQLQHQLSSSLNASIYHNMTPPYVPIMPGANETWWESLENQIYPDQQWGHRVYSELLQSGTLSSVQENAILDSLRAYYGTSIGVTTNFIPPNNASRELLGFISYGHAQALLRQDRIEEYLLFLYSHRFNTHTRGTWTASEVAEITGDITTFCLPAQMTSPILLRWALVYDDDGDALHLARGIPRRWLADPKGISVSHVPTRWGEVGYSLQYNKNSSTVTASLSLPDSVSQTKLYLRLPDGLTVNKESFKNSTGYSIGSTTNATAYILITGSPSSSNLTIPVTSL